MVIGVPREIKNNENRVSMTPAGVHAMASRGQTVLVEAGAGAGSGFADGEYLSAGAEITGDKRALFDSADIIVKVKEPLEEEYPLLHEGQALYTYLHLAPEPALTRALLEKKIVGIAYETIEGPSGGLPLLAPMSEVAGRMAVQIGAHYLLKYNGGEGILLGAVPGVPPGQVTILGGGVVGTNAAKRALGLGALVTVIDSNLDRLRYLDDIFSGAIVTVKSNPYSIAEWVERSDLLIGAVLIPGARAPKLVTEAMVMSMKPGAVIVDVAIDQGGTVETADHVSTHDAPVYLRHGVLHYAVPNMPGAAPRTSTQALTNVTLDYLSVLCEKGFRRAFSEDRGLMKGLNTLKGHVTCPGVAEAQGLAYTDPAALL